MTNDIYLNEANASCLVLVDVQTKLTSVMPLKVLMRLRRNCLFLLKLADRFDMPIFYTEQYPEGLGNTEPEIVERLPKRAKLFTKTSFSCVGADGFLDTLKQSGKQCVVLSGMEAHICILQTALELRQHGYKVILLADAVCSRVRDSYETAIERMRDAEVVVTDTETLIFEWLRSSKHPHFKLFSEMIKASAGT